MEIGDELLSLVQVDGEGGGSFSGGTERAGGGSEEALSGHSNRRGQTPMTRENANRKDETFLGGWTGNPFEIPWGGCGLQAQGRCKGEGGI